MSERISSYQLDLNPGYAAIEIRKGPRVYSSTIWIDKKESPLSRRELRGRDFERIAYRSMAVVNRYTSNPVLIESRGKPLPFKLKTEDEEIEEIARGFLREHPDIYLGAAFGREYEVNRKQIGGN